MYCVIEFDNEKRECCVVPLGWLVEDQKFCVWPNINNEDLLQEYVTSQKSPLPGWKKYKLRKVRQICVTYEDAVAFLDKLLEESCSSSSTNDQQQPSLTKKKLIIDDEEEVSENGYLQGQVKRKTVEKDSQSGISKKLKTVDTIECESTSADEFSSEDEKSENTKKSKSIQKVTTESFSNSLDTTITYVSSASSSMHLSSTPTRSNTPNSLASTRHNLDTNFMELLLRKVEKLDATQDQHSIVLDNILRNLQLQHNDLAERPRDFPKLPIENKSDYRAVEEFLADPDKFAYMKKRLSTIGGSSVRNTVMNIMKFLMSNQVGMKFNWAGKDKRAFKKTKMCEVLFEAVRLAYSGTNFKNEVSNDKIIKESIQDWLKLSKARYNYSQNKEKK